VPGGKSGDSERPTVGPVNPLAHALLRSLPY
jgi:hypothetical protein